MKLVSVILIAIFSCFNTFADDTKPEKDNAFARSFMVSLKSEKAESFNKLLMSEQDFIYLQNKYKNDLHKHKIPKKFVQNSPKELSLKAAIDIKESIYKFKKRYEKLRGLYKRHPLELSDVEEPDVSDASGKKIIENSKLPHADFFLYCSFNYHDGVLIKLPDCFLVKGQWKFAGTFSLFSGTRRKSNEYSKFETQWKYGLAHKQIAYEKDNGLIWHNYNYKDGLCHGPCLMWHDNGSIWYKHNYKNGRSHGTCTYWYENGKKESSTRYYNGEEHGKKTLWDKSGKIIAHGTYRFGDPFEGTFQEGYGTSSMNSINIYKNGKLVTGYIDIYIPVKGIWEDNSWSLINLVTLQYKDSNLIEVHNINADEDGKYIMFTGDKKMAMKGNFKDSKPHGKWTQLDENEKICSVIYFENGKIKHI
ncbi:MAG: toxin-antitoxin system YwqK family antitoxin [Planctomycetota bacterium]|jgi:antitoxin component YwqK of YwqJK toxin-antitoxin module